MAIAFHRLRIADVRRETPDAVSIAFVVPPELIDDYRFAPGQHLTLRAHFDGEECRRSYSICTAPDDGELRVAIKRVEGGRFSAWVNDTLKAGDEIDVMTPQGRFGLTSTPDTQHTSTPDAQHAYLAVAAGSGITPVISLARTLLARDGDATFTLLYGNRTSQSIIFKDALDDMKDRFIDRFTVHHVLSREQQELALLNGRIDAAKVTAAVAAMGGAAAIDHVFLCGPGGMIEESKATLLSHGVPATKLHIEYFSADGAPVIPKVPAPAMVADFTSSATAQITLNGVVSVVPMRQGESIIEAGIRQGLDMPYACRGGMCCTCRAMLVDGEVRMDLNYSLEPWEIEAGYVLTCQAHPVTPRVVVDYDQM